jgi:hypothetical protein
MSMIMLRNLFVAPLITLLLNRSAPAYAQVSDGPMVYESHNQVDPKPLKMHRIVGVARAENNSLIPNMEVGLFTEGNRSLVATASTNQDGKFSFAHIPVGRYRVVAKHAAFCTVNVPIIVESDGLGSGAKILELNMKVGGIDVCSFGKLIGASRTSSH